MIRIRYHKSNSIYIYFWNQNKQKEMISVKEHKFMRVQSKYKNRSKPGSEGSPWMRKSKLKQMHYHLRDRIFDWRLPFEGFLLFGGGIVSNWRNFVYITNFVFLLQVQFVLLLFKGKPPPVLTFKCIIRSLNRELISLSALLGVLLLFLVPQGPGKPPPE